MSDSKTGKSGNGSGNGNGQVAAAPARSFLPEIDFRLPDWASRLLRPRYPGLGILFMRDRFALARVLPGRKGGRPLLTHLSSHELPGGTLLPSLSEPNIKAPAEVAARIGRALDGLPNRRKLSRVSLVLPDACARVIILDLQNVPRSRRQAEQMIRWQVRKRVPFQLDEARLTVQRFPLAGAEERVVVALALDRILAPYEQVAEALDLRPGLLDLAAFNLANLCLGPADAEGSAGDEDVAILNVEDAELSVLMFRAGKPLFYRSKPLLHDPATQVEESRREIRRELITSSAYYRERLAGAERGVSRAWLRMAGGHGLDLGPLVQETFDVGVERVEAGRMVAPDEGVAPSPALLELAAPALGATAGRWL